MVVGVFDSGIGGLSFFRELDRQHPSASRIYLGDHANLPYGEKSPEEIIRMTYAGVSQLADFGCDRIIIACNTASIFAAASIKSWFCREKNKVRILDITSPTIRFIQCQLKSIERKLTESHKRTCRVGVFATSATVQSNYFKTEIGRLGNTEVHQVACHQLVELIENSKPIEYMRACICSYVDELHRKFFGLSPHFVILGCTHYSVVRDLFCGVLGEDCRILNQEHLLLEHLLAIDAFPDCNSTPPVRRLLTTGDKNKANKAARLLAGEQCFEFENFQLKRR